MVAKSDTNSYPKTLTIKVTVIEKLNSVLDKISQTALELAKQTNEDPKADPATGIYTLWEIYRSSPDISSSQRAQAVELYLDNLEPHKRILLENDDNGSRLREITNEESRKPMLPRTRINSQNS